MAEEKKKSALAAMMAGADKEKDEAKAPVAEEDSEGLATAADEVFDALKSDDREAFKVALKSYVEMC